MESFVFRLKKIMGGTLGGRDVVCVGWGSEQDLALPCPQATDWAHWGCDDMPRSSNWTKKAQQHSYGRWQDAKG